MTEAPDQKIYSDPRTANAKGSGAHTIGLFTTDKPIFLESAPNGGWVVSQYSDPHSHPTRLGAYSTAQDMLLALQNALVYNAGGQK